jgi:uncharacterized protein YbaA (DUF1428 family)
MTTEEDDMTYVDGFMAAVLADRKAEFIAFGQKNADLFREYGALRVVDCWSDDVPHGKQTDFYRAVKASDGEAVSFGWVEWASKEARDTAWAAMMKDPRMVPGTMEMPFDGARMVYGGFAMVQENGAKP